jgi:NAD(P)-dependent dehydrogenase (short-subunit alcohol dehydrogenase family)
MNESLPFLITGANRGLGLAVTRLLIERGFKVIAVARNRFASETSLKDVVKNRTLVQRDLSRSMSDEDYAGLKSFGKLAGIVHCASPFEGTLKKSSASQLADWGNFYSNALVLGKLALEQIDQGQILFIGSIVGTLGKVSKTCAPYSGLLLARAMSK